MSRENKIIIAVLSMITIACAVGFIFSINYGHSILAVISGIISIIFFVFTCLCVMAIAEID